MHCLPLLTLTSGGGMNLAASLNIPIVSSTLLPIAAATSPGQGGALVQMINGFLPFPQLLQTVNSCMPIMDLIALFLIVLFTVQDVPKHQGDALLVPFARAMVLLGVIWASSPLTIQLEMLAQDIVKSIGTASGNQETWLVSNTVGDPQTSILYDFSQPYRQISELIPSGGGGGYIWSGIKNSNDWSSPKAWIDSYLSSIGLATPAGFNLFKGAAAGAAESQVNGIVIVAIGAVGAFAVFIMQVMLVVQKGIIIFGRLFMPPFIALFACQGPTRFLGVNYIQRMLGVLAWPIGWAIGDIGTEAGLKDVVSTVNHMANSSPSISGLLVILLNVALICLWLVLVAVMGPMLIQQVITAGGDFAGSMMGAMSGKVLGAPSAVMGAAGTGAGLALGAAGGPAGMVAGAQAGGGIGGQLGGIGTSSLSSGIGGATGQGGGGGGGAGLSQSASQYAGLQYMAQMAQQNNSAAPT